MGRGERCRDQRGMDVYFIPPQKRKAAYQRTANAFQTNDEVMYK